MKDKLWRGSVVYLDFEISPVVYIFRAKDYTEAEDKMKGKLAAFGSEVRLGSMFILNEDTLESGGLVAVN